MYEIVHNITEDISHFNLNSKPAYDNLQTKKISSSMLNLILRLKELLNSFKLPDDFQTLGLRINLDEITEWDLNNLIEPTNFITLLSNTTIIRNIGEVIVNLILSIRHTLELIKYFFPATSDVYSQFILSKFNSFTERNLPNTNPIQNLTSLCSGFYILITLRSHFVHMFDLYKDRYQTFFISIYRELMIFGCFLLMKFPWLGDLNENFLTEVKRNISTDSSRERLSQEFNFL